MNVYNRESGKSEFGSGNCSKGLGHSQKPKLLDQVRDVIRCKHYSIRTEESYINWIKRYIFFLIKNIPRIWEKLRSALFWPIWLFRKMLLLPPRIRLFVHLFFYIKRFWNRSRVVFNDLVRAKKPAKLPVVFTRLEVKEILLQISGRDFLSLFNLLKM